MVSLGSMYVVKLLKLRVVPELLYALQELDVLSGAPNLHRAATRVSQGRSSCDCHCVRTHRQWETDAEKRWVKSEGKQKAEDDSSDQGDEPGRYCQLHHHHLQQRPPPCHRWPRTNNNLIYQYCGSLYIEFGSEFRILAQFRFDFFLASEEKIFL